MRILIYGLNFLPEPTGVGRYTGEMAEWFAGRGHSVRVVTAVPYYPKWQVFEGYSRFRYRESREHGVEVVRVPLWVPPKPTASKRLLHLASFVASSTPAVIKAAVTFSPDIVLGIVPTFMTAPIALAASRLSGARSWMHVQDLEIDAAIELGMISSRPAVALARKFESSIVRGFDGVSSISRTMGRRLAEKRNPTDSCTLVPNWVDTERIRPLPGESPLRAELGYDRDEVVALYSGNLGAKQGLDAVAASARRLRDHDHLRFLICGEGPARDDLERSTRDIDHVQFIPLQPDDRFNELLNAADIHLVPQRADADGLVMPSKVTGILACGGRILATCASSSELGEVVSDVGGRICEPESPEAFATALIDLADQVLAARSSPGRCGYSKEARQYAERYLDRGAILRRLEKQFLGLSGEPAGDARNLCAET